MKSTRHYRVQILPTQLQLPATISVPQSEPEPLMAEWFDVDFTTADFEEIFPLVVLEPAEGPAFVRTACREGEVRRCDAAYQQSMAASQRPGMMINLWA